MDLTTLSSLRACRTLKTVVKRKIFTWPIDPFVTSDVSDVQNCGKTQISHFAERPFRHFGRVGRSKLWQNANSCTCPSDPFVTSDVSDAQNCGKMQILEVAEQPFRHFGRVGRKTVVKLTFLTGLNRTTVKN